MVLLSKVILVGEDPQVRDAVGAALRNGDGGELAACRDLEELAARLDADPSMVVLVDDGPCDALLADLEPVVNRYAHSRFVVLTAQRTPQMLMRSMQIGIRHIQLKRDIPEELGYAVGALLGTLSPVQAARGSLITVLSAGGGCGATTLATNLALELHACGRDPVLLVDGDSHYGSIGVYLNIEGRYGLDYLLGSDRLDAALLQSTAFHYQNGFDVMLNPAVESARRGGEPAPERLAEILELCAKTYSMTIVDLPRPAGAALEYAARASSLVLIVMQPAIKDIRMARILARMLDAAGVAPGQLMIVVNRYQKQNPIQLAQIQKIFAPTGLFCVGNDFDNANRAATEGQPLSQCARRSRLARDIAELALSCASRARNPRNEVAASLS